ncbi:MAG TPA: hypothetical protein DCP97_01690 [Ruminococcaceae bacterium]|nr:hypothetical protein [Oscillospiraceae bacterium]
MLHGSTRIALKTAPLEAFNADIRHAYSHTLGVGAVAAWRNKLAAYACYLWRFAYGDSVPVNELLY